jgi:hypothetical protein
MGYARPTKKQLLRQQIGRQKATVCASFVKR